MSRASNFRYKDLIDRVSRSTGFPKEQVKAIVDNAAETVLVHATLGKNVMIDNFGIFKMKHLGKRSIEQHYISGERAIAPEHMKLSFKEAAYVKRVMADVLQDTINGMLEENEKQSAQEDDI